ncbi:MAG: AMP-binding protein [Dehalococcoidia bacterium]
MPLDGFTPWPEKLAREYKAKGYWPDQTIPEVLEPWFRKTPDRVAIVDETSRVTYGELGSITHRLSLAMLELGVKKEDRVLLQLPNWAEFFYFYFGLMKFGAIPVMAIPHLRSVELGHLMGLTDPVAMAIPPSYRGFDYIALAEELRRQFPKLAHIIVVRGQAPPGMHSLDDLLGKVEAANYPPNYLDRLKPDPDDVAFILHTGGTTGLPKGVCRTHNDFLSNYNTYQRHWGWGPDTVNLSNLPVELNASLGRATNCLLVGGKEVVITSTTPEAMIQAIETEGVNDMLPVPTQGVDLLNLPDLEQHDLSALKRMYCGVGVFTADQLRTLRDRMGCQILRAYGMTEGPTLRSRPTDTLEEVIERIGPPCCEVDEFKIVDEEGNEVPRGQEGELLAQGPHVIRGYYKAPEENQRSFDRDGFFRTGDNAFIDEKGYIRLTGRKKDWIRRGGQTIIPLEIEDPLISHPKIENAAAVGMPDPRLGERTCIYIQPRPGQSITLEEVTQYLQEKGLAKYKLPERIELVSQMPLTGHGKVDKKPLREAIAQKLEAEGKV